MGANIDGMLMAIYCRISRLKDEGKDRSIDNQMRLGVEKAAELNMDYRFYIDEGLSGASDDVEDRPELDKLLEDIVCGEISTVFAYDLARMERSPQVRFVLKGVFKKHNVRWITHMNGEIDLYDPQAEFFGDILSVINRYQVTMTRVNVKGVLKRRALDGKVHGILPYGYMRDENSELIVNESEAAVVRRIFDLSLSGIGTRSIAMQLNKEGVPTRYNTLGEGVLTVKNKYTKERREIPKSQVKWAPNTVRSIIVNSIYKGQRKYGNMVLDVPKIVEADYFDRVNENLRSNANTSGKKVVHQYLLKGLIRCGVCGRNMYGRARVSKRDYYYMCSSKRIAGESCGNRSIGIGKIEDFIWQNLFLKSGFKERLRLEFEQSSELISQLHRDFEYQVKEIDGLSAERQRVIDFGLKRFISDAELETRLRRLDAQIKEAKIKFKEIDESIKKLNDGSQLLSKYGDDFVDFSLVTTFLQKQKVVNDFLRNVVVTCKDDTFYMIRIQYKLPIDDEVWRTMTLNDATFILTPNYRTEAHEYLVLTPPPMDNPTDKSRSEKLVIKGK